jgi:HNH endonuclease
VRARDLKRFLKLIHKEPRGCWLWLGWINNSGYALFYLDGKKVLAHRASYKHFVKRIRKGKQLDHLCRVRYCVKPTHLEQVTRIENMLRSPITNANKKHCPYGHPYDEKNTGHTMVKGRRRRYCRTCVNTRNKTRQSICGQGKTFATRIAATRAATRFARIGNTIHYCRKHHGFHIRAPFNDVATKRLLSKKVVALKKSGARFEDIGDALGMSRTRAHQIYWAAVA